MTPAIKSYSQAKTFFSASRGRKDWQRISAHLRIYKRGNEFTITNKGGSTPFVTITPDNVFTLHFNNMLSSLGRCSVPYHLWAYFRIQVFHKADRRSTQHWWYRNRKDGVDYPVANELSINADTGLPVSSPPEIERRRVRRDVAKPIRDKIADWQKLATSYLALETNFTQGFLEKYEPKLPELEDEVTMDGLLKMLRWGAQRGTGYMLYGHSNWRSVSQDMLQARAKRAFNLAFEKWKEQLYTEHGCFSWVKVDKAA